MRLSKPSGSIDAALNKSSSPENNRSMFWEHFAIRRLHKESKTGLETKLLIGTGHQLYQRVEY
jgi:hypothetical protein